jgi:hypothetical protein
LLLDLLIYKNLERYEQNVGLHLRLTTWSEGQVHILLGKNSTIEQQQT